MAFLLLFYFLFLQYFFRWFVSRCDAWMAKIMWRFFWVFFIFILVLFAMFRFRFCFCALVKSNFGWKQFSCALFSGAFFYFLIHIYYMYLGIYLESYKTKTILCLDLLLLVFLLWFLPTAAPNFSQVRSTQNISTDVLYLQYLGKSICHMYMYVCMCLCLHHVI